MTYKNVKIQKIEIIENEDVYDLTIEDNHNFFANGLLVHNCVEIGMIPYFLEKETKISGWQGCNLTEGNGSKCTTKARFLEICKGLAILGTIQASYTDFKYVKDVTKKIFDKEALLGCSLTGWMMNPHILFDEEIMREGARLIKEINKEVAEMIGINQAARLTCVKPSGNASVLLETSSGIHGDHARRYFRNMQINKESEIAKMFMDKHEYMTEESLWSSLGTDIVVSFPVLSTDNAIFKYDLLDSKLLEYVKKAQMNWVEEGTNEELCTIKSVRHNISNTIDVVDFDEVADFIFENKKYFSGVSMLRYGGDKAYVQAPFQAVLTEEEIIAKYGAAGILASGLIMDGLNGFDNDLWKACDFSLDMKDKKMKIDGTRLQVMVKKDWLRRSKQFAKRFFKNDVQEMTHCLKDVHLFHRWTSVNRELKSINLEELNLKPEYTEIDTLGSVACQGGACEMPAEYLDKFKK